MKPLKENVILHGLIELFTVDILTLVSGVRSCVEYA
jgi:hypothetical protein